MKRLLMAGGMLLAACGAAQAQTVHILMETVPDTEFVKALLPEFKAATGIDVEIEAISYIDMHSKLVPQLVAPQGSYDAIVVDFYWVGEFTKAGWLMPLDELIAKDKVDTGVYVPKLMDLVGKVEGVTYMLPFYNYSMGIIYRQDLIDDPANQKAFKDKYGIDLKVPTAWDEYKKQVEFFTKDNDGDGKADFFGTVTQAQRGDCISMQWSNYLYGNGGRYVDENWNPTLNSEAGVKALDDYREHTTKYSPPGSEGFCFDEAFQVLAQGKAYSFVTFNILYSSLQDPKASTVVGKVGIAPNPGGGLNGAWGWAIPKSSPEKDAAWTFIKWIESPEIAKKRALAGGAPTQTAMFTDPDVVKARPYMPVLQQLLENTQDFVVFSYTTEYVETLGRELNLAATGQKSAKEALDVAAEELAKLAKKDGKLKE